MEEDDMVKSMVIASYRDEAIRNKISLTPRVLASTCIYRAFGFPPFLDITNLPEYILFFLFLLTAFLLIDYY